MNFFENVEKYKRREIRKYNEGTVIAHEDDFCDGIYVVKKGTVVIKNIYLDGKETVLKYIKENEIYGDILIFSSNNKFPASIFALTDCEIEFVDKNTIFKMINDDASFALYMLNKISLQVYDLNNRLKLLSKKTIRSKICYFIITESKNKDTFTLGYTHEQLASLLNVERPSFSRELSKLRNEGIIKLEHKKITILNKELLLSYL